MIGKQYIHMFCGFWSGLLRVSGADSEGVREVPLTKNVIFVEILGKFDKFRIPYFTLDSHTPYSFLILLFNKSILLSISVCKIAIRVANTVDPDQTSRSVASDLGLHCLLRPVFPNT